MRRALAPFSKLESSNHTQSSADFITNTSGFSFRYTQVMNLIQADDPLPINVTRAVYTVVDRQTRVIISVVQNKHRVTGEQHVVPFDECEEIGSAEVVF